MVQIKMHEYMRCHGYKCPDNSSHGPFQWSLNTDLSYFEHIHANLERTTDFNTCMVGNRVARQHWLDWFPVESEILADASESVQDVLLVDVGGGGGHDLEKFLTRFPESKGRLVLQDLPTTIDNITSLDGIHCMAHDFFGTQPTKGEQPRRH